MADEENGRALGARPGGNVEGLSMKDLLGRITADVTALAKKEIELAKAELKQHVSSTKTLVEGLGVAAVLALLAVNMLLVTVVFALATVMPGWAAGLIVTGVLLAAAAIAGYIGWRKRVRTPLEMTRRHVKEDVKWVKERMA